MPQTLLSIPLSLLITIAYLKPISSLRNNVINQPVAPAYIAPIKFLQKKESYYYYEATRDCCIWVVTSQGNHLEPKKKIQLKKGKVVKVKKVIQDFRYCKGYH